MVLLSLYMLVGFEHAVLWAHRRRRFMQWLSGACLIDASDIGE